MSYFAAGSAAVEAAPSRTRTSGAGPLRRRLGARLSPRPEFWLVLALAAFLRLWHVDRSLLLGDQTGLLALARAGWARGALPVTGIPSSIGTLNPPLSVYALMPIAAFTGDPLPQVIALAIWNLFGVALAYLLAERVFGRRVAFWSGLLFATTLGPVSYSRFLWQQNDLPPLITLWALTLFAGAQGKRRWFAANVITLVAAALLHPTALLLAPVTLVGWLLAPARPRRWEYLVVAGAALALLAPTALWEARTNFSDVTSYLHYNSGRTSYNPQVIQALYYALGGQERASLGAQTVFGQWLALSSALALASCAAVAFGALVLTRLVVAPVWRDWRAQPTAHPALRRALAVWRARRADAVWRARALLWLMIVAPFALLIRHSSHIYPHYLIILFPAAFIVAGVGIEWAHTRLAARRTEAGAQAQTDASLAPARASAPARVSLLALVATVLAGLLVAGQVTQSLAYISSIEGSGFSTYSGYGYPLDEVRAADARLSAFERQQGTQRTVVFARPGQFQENLARQLLDGRTDRVGSSADCLILPESGAALAVTTDSAMQVTRALATLPNARQIGAIAMPGAEPLGVWRITPAPPLADETALPPANFSAREADGLRLEAGRTAANLVRLRWTVLASTPGSAPPSIQGASAAPQFLLMIDQRGGDGRLFHGYQTCAPTRWKRGDTLFAWTLLAPADEGDGAQALEAGDLAITVWSRSQDYRSGSVGGLRYLADQQTEPPWRHLTPTFAGGSSVPAHAATISNGAYVTPALALVPQ